MTAQECLTVIPITLRLANVAVLRWHRHHPPATGAKWALGCVDSRQVLHGVAIAGRPVSPTLDDGTTVEVARVATDGTPNACSCLYGAMRRVAKEMGYCRIITYVLDSEPGTSLRASGWVPTVLTEGRAWSRPSRPCNDRHPLGPKQRWECQLRPRALNPAVPVFGAPTTIGTLFEGVS